MATEVTVAIVDPDSGPGTTHTSLSAAEADASIAGVNYPSLDQIPIILCRSTSGTADTTATTFAGWTLDATRYLIIRADVGHRHTGVWDTAKYRLSTNGGTALRIDTADTRADYLQIENSSGGSNTVPFRFQGARQVHSCCIVRSGTGTSAQGISSTASGIFPTLINCLLINRGGASSSGIIDTSSSSGTGFQVYSCTLIGGGNGTCFNTIASPTNTNTARDCIVSGWATFKSAAAMNAATNYNSTNLASGDGGANSQVSQTFTFVNAAGGDYHLDNADTGAKGLGEDLSALGFNTDVDGTVRGATWDIGFDQITAGGTDVTVNPTGVGATGSVGTVSVSGAASNTPTGQSATSAIGDETVAAGAGVSPTGQSSNGSVGVASLSGGGSVPIGGVGASGSVGTVSVTTEDEDADVDAGGQQADATPGSVIVSIINPSPQQGGGIPVFIPSHGFRDRLPEKLTVSKPKKKQVRKSKAKSTPPKVENVDEYFESQPEVKAPVPPRVDVVVPVSGLTFKMDRPFFPKVKSIRTSARIETESQSLQAQFGEPRIATWSPPTADEVADKIRGDIEAIFLSQMYLDKMDEEEEQEEAEEAKRQEMELEIENNPRLPKKRMVKILRGTTGEIAALEIEEIT